MADADDTLAEWERDYPFRHDPDGGGVRAGATSMNHDTASRFFTPISFSGGITQVSIS